LIGSRRGGAGAAEQHLHSRQRLRCRGCSGIGSGDQRDSVERQPEEINSPTGVSRWGHHHPASSRPLTVLFAVVALAA